MKVIHVVTSTNVGGAQIMLQRYLSALGNSTENHSVISLVSSGPIASIIRELGVSVSDLGLPPGRVTPAALAKLRAQLRGAAPDIVHGWMYHGCLAAWTGIAGWRGGARPAVVWGIHHSLQDIANEKRKTRLVLRAMAAVSHKVQLITYCAQVSRTQHEAVGFCKDRVAVIPNSVNTQVFRPDPSARARLARLCAIPDGRLLIGNVARAHPMKDHVSFVRAVAHLAKMGHDVHGVLLGEGHRDSPALHEATTLGIQDRISPVDTRSDVETLVPGFDIFLLSSAWGEAFPLAVCEAMAAAVPCVVTDVGDCAYLVGDTGGVTSPSDPLAQANEVARMIKMGREGRLALGQRARARVKELFSDSQYVEHHNRAYEQAQWSGSDMGYFNHVA